MYSFQLIFWFITYSILIASTTISIGAAPSGLRRGYRACILTNLSILLMVISVSLVFFFYSLSRLDSEGWSSFIFQFLFYLGVSSATLFSLEIPNTVFPDAENKKTIRPFALIVILFFTAHLISFLLVMIVVEHGPVVSLINGIFQLGILSLFFLSSIRVAVKLAVSWKSGRLWIRIILSIVCIIFILAVFSIDVAYGIWSKIHSHRELSLFYVFPAFLTVLSILLTSYTVYSVRQKTARGRSSTYALKSYRLSSREIEVASLITEGRSYQEAADSLYVSLATVQSHIKSIYRKTGVNSKIELANLCNNGGSSSV